MREKAEELLFEAPDPYFGLIENGATEDEADRICYLMNRAIVTVEWPDNV